MSHVKYLLSTTLKKIKIKQGNQAQVMRSGKASVFSGSKSMMRTALKCLPEYWETDGRNASRGFLSSRWTLLLCSCCGFHSSSRTQWPSHEIKWPLTPKGLTGCISQHLACKIINTDLNWSRNTRLLVAHLFFIFVASPAAFCHFCTHNRYYINHAWVWLTAIYS